MSKLEEAEEHLRAAAKYLKTSFLKWKPDFDSAADEYSQAAQCFRIARNLEKSKATYLQASDCYKSNRSFFHAAKSIETAIIVSKEFTKPDEVYQLAETAASLYQQHGSGDSAASLLDKAGKIIEQARPELALKLFQRAADVSSCESSSHQAAEYISKASRILVKLGLYDQAVDSLRREIGYHQEHDSFGAIGRLTVCVVLVQLARGDPVAAEKSYKEWGNSCEAAEATVVERLLCAYDEEDAAAARSALASPFIRHMDVEYARLAQTVPLPAGIEISARPNNAQNNQEEDNASSVYATQSTALVGDNASSNFTSDSNAASAAKPPLDEEEDELC